MSAVPQSYVPALLPGEGQFPAGVTPTIPAGGNAVGDVGAGLLGLAGSALSGFAAGAGYGLVNRSNNAGVNYPAPVWVLGQTGGNPFYTYPQYVGAAGSGITSVAPSYPLGSQWPPVQVPPVQYPIPTSNPYGAPASSNILTQLTSNNGIILIVAFAILVLIAK